MSQPEYPPVVLDPAGTDLHGEERRLRARGPVTQVELPGGVVVWSVTSADILKSLLTDSRVSKDAVLHWPDFAEGRIPADWPLIGWVALRSMFTAYGDDHTRLRRLIAPAFTARRTKALRPRIEDIVRSLLDDIAGTPPGDVVDIRERFARPIPIQVINDLLGVPESIRPRLDAANEGAFNTNTTPEEALAIYVEAIEIMNDLVAAKRAEPDDLLTSFLIAAHDEDGTTLSETELADTLILMFSAGYEASVNLLDQAIHALLTHPEQLAHLHAGRTTWSDVIEETLRVEAPVAHLPLRYAVEDIDLRERAGVVIRRGEAILPDFGAAGRDPELLHGAVEDHRRSGIPDGKRSELGIPHAGNLPRCGLSDARGLRELCEAITAGLDAGVRWWTRRIRGTVDVLTGKRRCIRGTASMPGIAAGSPLRSW